MFPLIPHILQQKIEKSPKNFFFLSLMKKSSMTFHCPCIFFRTSSTWSSKKKNQNLHKIKVIKNTTIAIKVKGIFITLILGVYFMSIANRCKYDIPDKFHMKDVVIHSISIVPLHTHCMNTCLVIKLESSFFHIF